MSTKQSASFKVEEEANEVLSEGLVLNEQEINQLGVLRQRIDRARDQRDRQHRQFDDLTYLEDYQANEDAILTYLRPKINDGEVRINTATSEKKLETVKNEILSFNYQAEVRAFDQDNDALDELGDDISDLLTESEIKEGAEDNNDEALTHLQGQRALFMEERFVDKEIEDKRARKFNKNGVLKIRIQRPEKFVLDGRQIYLGDITIPARKINDQPYIIKYERKLWIEAKNIYGDNPRWKFVKPGAGGSTEESLFNYRMHKSLEEYEVEIIHYYSYPDDEYQVIINGVPMNSADEKLPWEWEGYNITMTVIKAIPGFAYGKSLISSAKTIQGLENETLRLMIRKFRQGIDPPSVTSKKINSKDIFNPGTLITGMQPDEIKPIITHNGVNQSEFNMMQLVQKITGEFIGASDVAQGIEASGSQTATEVRTLQRNFIKQLGHSLLAWQRVKKDMARLRILNILENFTDPIDRVKDKKTGKFINVYRKFTVNNAKLGDGETGTKIIQFLDRNLEPEEKQELFRMENELELMGKKTRIKTLNVKQLREIFVFWYIVVNPKIKEGSDVDKLLFTDELNQGMMLAQAIQQPLNGASWISSFERVYNTQDRFAEALAPQEQEEGGIKEEANKMLGQIEELDKSFAMAGAAPQKPQRATVNSVQQ